MGIWENSMVFYHHGTVFEPKQCLYQNVAKGVQNLKMYSPYRCNKRTGLYWPAKYPGSHTSVRAANWNVGKFEGFDQHGTVFEPKQSLYQNVTKGVQNLKM